MLYIGISNMLRTYNTTDVNLCDAIPLVTACVLIPWVLCVAPKDGREIFSSCYNLWPWRINHH